MENLGSVTVRLFRVCPNVVVTVFVYALVFLFEGTPIDTAGVCKMSEDQKMDVCYAEDDVVGHLKLYRKKSYQIPQTVGDRILTIPEDITKGKRVLVIGDVHGCYDELASLLIKADAVKTENITDGLKDDVIVVFVGDLVNKGPKSMEVLHFAMFTERVYSVLGNHEVYWLQGYHPSSFSRNNTKFMSYLQSLPYVISIPEHNAVIVHAGFLPGLSLAEQPTKDIILMRNIRIKPGINSRLGEKHFVAYTETDDGVHWATLWQGPQHVYYGHDARRGQDAQGNPRVQRFPLVTGLDTRCVKGGALTAVKLPVEKEEFYSVPSKRVYSLT